MGSSSALVIIRWFPRNLKKQGVFLCFFKHLITLDNSGIPWVGFRKEVNNLRTFPSKKKEIILHAKKVSLASLDVIYERTAQTAPNIHAAAIPPVVNTSGLPEAREAATEYAAIPTTLPTFITV